MWQNSKTQIVTTQKLGLWQNSKTQIVTVVIVTVVTVAVVSVQRIKQQITGPYYKQLLHDC